MDEYMEQITMKANTLIEALPYIRQFNNKMVVVKYGGSAMVDEELQQSVIKDVALLKLIGMKPIIVHGGGKEISKWIGKVGKEPKLHGQDIGYVGTIKHVNPSLIESLINDDFIPIIAPIGLDDAYQTYNINADDAACAVAEALGAEKLVFLTDIDGVCTDPEDKDTLISLLTLEKAHSLIEEGYIGGGMLPKLNNCIDAVKNGVNRVHILDGRKAHCLLLEFFTNRGIGTAIIKDEGWLDNEQDNE